MTVNVKESDTLKGIKAKANAKKVKWKIHKDVKDKEAKEQQMVESLLDTLKKGEDGEIRSMLIEPRNTFGMHLALPHKGQSHKRKIVEHKIDEDGNDLLVAEFHTGSRDTFTYNDILSALRQEENMQEEAYFTFEVLDRKEEAHRGTG